VTECNTISYRDITLSGNAATHRKTATVVQVGAANTHIRAMPWVLARFTMTIKSQARKVM